MYELEACTCAAGRPGRISSTVDARQPRLLEYYRRQGGTVEATGEARSALRFRLNCQVLQWPVKSGDLGALWRTLASQLNLLLADRPPARQGNR